MWTPLASVSLSQLAFLGTALAAIAGVAVTLLRLRPELNRDAVELAHGTSEKITQFNQQLMEDRDFWRTRALAAEAKSDQLQDQADELEEALEQCRKRHPPPRHGTRK